MSLRRLLLPALAFSALLGPGSAAAENAVTAPSSGDARVGWSPSGMEASHGLGNEVAVSRTARAASSVKPGRVIRTRKSWECRGSLRRFGKLPIKVVSRIPNPGTADAIRLIGCYGDGNPKTVDLILDVRGNGRDLGTGYDAVKIGQSAHDLVVTGRVACGARHGSIHQDVVQAMSGYRIKFKDFRSGRPADGRWTCWGAGGGWYVSHANGNVPRRVVCVRCRIATYNQNMRIDNAVRSGARDSVFGYSRSYGIFIGPQAVNPVNVRNRVIRY